MNVISEETGITKAEMKNDLVFADVGVDSLLSLAISGRLREELNIDVSSTLFIEYPTVGDLKRSLGAASGPADASEDSSKNSTLGSGFSSDEDTAETSSDFTNVDEDDKAQDSMHGERYPISGICTILADELGVKVEDVWNAQSLAELGLDSLMSLTMLGRLREELNIDLPMDFFFDADMITIRNKLRDGSPGSKIPGPVTTASKPIIGARTADAIPAATSVLLQGNLTTARKVLFLFPDGSGSAVSYATLPLVAPDVAVVGLNCPYVKRPQDMKCALQDLTAPYLAEICRRQAHGPYYLGGWSAGGICAYDAAAMLMDAGEQVATLILVDSPNPIRLEKLPLRMYDFLNSAGMFGSGGSEPLPEWLLPHFLAFVDALALYEPTPFAPGTAPITHVIWAAEGVYRSTGGKKLEEQPDDTREMKWLLNDRTNFGPNGWDELVKTESLNIEVLEGANHFTMMDGPQGLRLSQFLARSMGV
jgi:naphtho-gamma-pyrone polyketide synthase